MKLKAFGLVEAVIATAIMLLFVTGMFYLSAKSSALLGRYERTAVASQAAGEFFADLQILHKSQRLTNGLSGQGQVSMECFNSSKASDCLSQIGSGFESEMYPFKTMVEVSNEEFLALKNIVEKAGGTDYKLKSLVSEPASGQHQIDLEIIWKHNGKKENLKLSKIINE